MKEKGKIEQIKKRSKESFHVLKEKLMKEKQHNHKMHCSFHPNISLASSKLAHKQRQRDRLLNSIVHNQDSQQPLSSTDLFKTLHEEANIIQAKKNHNYQKL